MKVLQLGKFYPILGGVEKVMYSLMTGLSARGMRCDMMCAAVEGNTRVLKINENADLILCRTLRKVKGTMIAPDMVSELKRRCAGYGIIHVHHPDPMAALALRMSGYKGKVVLHWHSDILKQKYLLRFYAPLQKWLINRADKIVGTTKYYLEESPWLKGYGDKSVALPIGIDPVVPDQVASESIRTIYDGRKIVFSLGRLVPYKGFQYLVRAAEYLPDDYVVLIGGAGPLEDELAELIAESGLKDKVHLLGRIGDEDLPAYFGACNLFCLSSVYKTEAFGIVQIEAMSCAKPVVATKIPGSGVSKVNADGFSGINVEPCDPEALADAILAINKDENTYSGFSVRALERYKTLFTKDLMLDGCCEIYNNNL